MKNNKKSVFLIGLVDIDDPKKGDTIHFKLLKKSLEQSFNIKSITLGEPTTSTSILTKMKTPSNALVRLLYWNIIILRTLIRNNKREDIKHIHIRPSGLVISHYLYCICKRIKFSIEVNGLIAESLESSFIYKWVIKFYTYIFKNASFIAGSIGYMRYVQKKFYLSAHKTVPVYLGYELITDSLEKNICFNKLGLSKEDKYLLSIGNIAEYQGVQFIGKSILKNLTEARNLRIKLLIVGEGTALPELINSFKEAGADDLLIVRERVSKKELELYFNIDAVGLSPFSPERGYIGSISGLKTYDYLFHKMPIITSIMDEMSDFIVKNNFGRSIHMFEDDEIFNLIKEVFEERASISTSFNEKWDDLKQQFQWKKRFDKIKLNIDLAQIN